MINPLIDIQVNLYFEIRNSSLYGGEGSVGYSSFSIGDFDDFDTSKFDDNFVKNIIQSIAGLSNVSSADVRLISKSRYKENTAETQEQIKDNLFR